ncbi:class I SAM-dependent methyltransferase [Chloroflexota bacterium]
MMNDNNRKPSYWDHVAKKIAGEQYFDELLAEQYRRVHLDLLAKWAVVTASNSVLKTDLFAEAMCPSRSFMWGMLGNMGNVIGIDISAEICFKAKINTAHYAPDSLVKYITCDVRQLPFASNSFDLIISDSTLDHFGHKSEIFTALSELTRVLKPGGTLIITMDNRGNLTEPLFRLWIRLGLAPFYIGETYSIGKLKQALTQAGLRIMDTTAIIHNPRFFTKLIVTILRRIEPTRFNGLINKLLYLLDSLENRKTRYLTAQFIAAKAVKPAI